MNAGRVRQIHGQLRKLSKPCAKHKPLRHPRCGECAFDAYLEHLVEAVREPDTVPAVRSALADLVSAVERRRRTPEEPTCARESALDHETVALVEAKALLYP